MKKNQNEEKIKNVTKPKDNRTKNAKSVKTSEPFLDLIDKNDYFDEEETKKEYIVNRNARKRLYFGYTTRLVFKTIIMFVLLTAIFICLLRFKQGPIIATSNYQINGKVDYKVYLKRNNYYESTILDSNMKYIASLINNIKLSYDYNFYSPDDYDLKYSYYITAKVMVYDAKNTNQIIYQSERTILDKQEKSLKGNNFKIEDNIDIDYDSYNELIKNFKQDYNLYASSNVVYTLHINVTGIHDEIEEKLVEDNEIDLTIPLTEQTVDIELSSSNISTNKSISGILKTESEKNITMIVILVVLVILFLISLINLILFVMRGTGKKSKYYRELSRILKVYDRAIAKTKDIVNINSDDNIIDIDTFEGLLDIRDNLNLPILFAEVHKGSKAWFVIRNGHDIYRYVLKGVDLGDN